MAQIRIEEYGFIGTSDVYRCLKRGITLVGEAITLLLHFRFIVRVTGSGFRDIPCYLHASFLDEAIYIRYPLHERCASRHSLDS